MLPKNLLERCFLVLVSFSASFILNCFRSGTDTTLASDEPLNANYFFIYLLGECLNREPDVGKNKSKKC